MLVCSGEPLYILNFHLPCVIFFLFKRKCTYRLHLQIWALLLQRSIKGRKLIIHLKFCRSARHHLTEMLRVNYVQSLFGMLWHLCLAWLQEVRNYTFLVVSDGMLVDRLRSNLLIEVRIMVHFAPSFPAIPRRDFFFFNSVSYVILITWHKEEV